MSEQYSVEERIQRGREARRILESPIFAEAVEAARQRFYQEWLASDDAAAQQGARSKTLALATVADALRPIISQGEHAEVVLRRAQ